MSIKRTTEWRIYMWQLLKWYYRDSQEGKKTLVMRRNVEESRRKRQLKMNLESTRSERVKQRIREQYKGKDREVKRSAREGKRRWVNGMQELLRERQKMEELGNYIG